MIFFINRWSNQIHRKDSSMRNTCSWC